LVTKSTICRNCGHDFTGSYCPDCGQPVIKIPYTPKSVVTYVISIFDFDRGYFHTLYTLFVRPGILIGDYLRGRTQPYNNPVKFLINSLGFVVLTELIYRVVASWLSNVPFKLSEVTDQLDLFTSPIVLFVLLFTPAFNYFFFRSENNFTEHIIISLFQLTYYFYITTIIVQVWYILLGHEVVLYSLYVVASLLLTIRYHLVVFVNRVRWKAILKSFLFILILLAALVVMIISA
jgi:hypothetical protein